jgi:hypothetical protein
MTFYQEPILAFGLKFKVREEAVAFCNDKYESDDLDEDGLLGLEYFKNEDSYILGYRMGIGESLDKYKAMWDTFFDVNTAVPESMLLIRNR